MRSTTVLAALLVTACAHGAQTRKLVVPTVNITEGRAFESYVPVPERAAAILGCTMSPGSPVCAVSPPDAAEDSAFHAEGQRLMSHSDLRCRELGNAIEMNRQSVRMYRKALVKESGNGRLYGVGHTYAIDSSWLVRVARRIDDLNERTLEEKKRTLRHEMSHTIGATESAEGGWSAEDYAVKCA